MQIELTNKEFRRLLDLPAKSADLVVVVGADVELAGDVPEFIHQGLDVLQRLDEALLCGLLHGSLHAAHVEAAEICRGRPPWWKTAPVCELVDVVRFRVGRPALSCWASGLSRLLLSPGFRPTSFAGYSLAFRPFLGFPL